MIVVEIHLHHKYITVHNEYIASAWNDSFSSTNLRATTTATVPAHKTVLQKCV